MPDTPLALALAFATLLYACESAPAKKAPPPKRDPQPPTTLAGREFVSESVEGRQLVGGTQIRLAFTKSALTAYAGCNHLSGPYRTEGDVLRIERLPPTVSACDRSLHEQDWWLQQLLLGSPRFNLEGWRLTLTTGDRLTLIDRARR